MKYITAFFIIIIAVIFRSWFSPGVIAGGDMPYYFPQMMHGISFLSSWDIRNIGMGSSMLPTLWVEFYSTSTLKTFSFLSWDIYIRLIWLFPYLLLSGISSYFVSRWYFKNKFFNLLTPFLYICNSYALLLVGGGQMGVALSYAVAPFGLIAFENFLKNLTLKSVVLFSLVFSLIFLLDIRIGYILFWILAIRFLFKLVPLTKLKVKKCFLLLIVSFLLIIGLHSFWLLPTALTRGEAIRQFGDIYTSKGAVQFFSFAKFENALGLLHPNWPENIFGLTHFMRPGFLILPIIVFSSLLFFKPFGLQNSLRGRQEQLYVLFFALVGLMGIFLAKGANEPFGQIYLWMFDHIPGFIMFRDPTKWYFLIAISYSMLIPYSIGKIFDLLQRNRLKNYTPYFFVISIIVYLFFLISPAILGKLGGTFKKQQFSPEYKRLGQFLSNKNNFSRTFWIPSVHRFGYFSNEHPAVSATDFFNTSSISGIFHSLSKKETETLLQDSSIQYIIVPYDSGKEIFLKDRKYSEALHMQVLDLVQKVAWLSEINNFGKLHVFKIDSAKDHFWLDGKGNLTYEFINPTKYKIHLLGVQKGESLIFTDSFDKYWFFEEGKNKVGSSPFKNTLNSFILPKSGEYLATVSFLPQKWVNLGVIISLFIFSLAMALLFLIK